MHARNLARCGFAAILVVATFALPVRAAETPEAVVGKYHSGVLAAAKANNPKTVRGLFDSFAQVVDNAFDFETMIKTAAGKHWRNATAQEQDELLAAFRRLSIATYAERFSDADKVIFDVAGARDGPRGMKLVSGELRTTDRKVDLIYVLRDKNDAWRIIDVLMDGGVSELALKTSEYSRILKEGGVPKLIKALNTQADSLLAG